MNCGGGTNLLHLQHSGGGDAVAVIEVPSRTKVKYEYDFEHGVLRVSRVCATSFVSPANYGFVPRTWCEDSSPLDILVLCREPLMPCTVVDVRILGVLEVTAQGRADPKLLSAAERDPVFTELRELNQVPEHLLREIAHFFAHYRELEGRKIEVGRWKPRSAALDVLKRARERYAERFYP